MRTRRVGPQKAIDILIDEFLILPGGGFAESEQCMNMSSTQEKGQELFRGALRVAYLEAPRSVRRGKICGDLLYRFERPLTIKRTTCSFSLVRCAIQCTVTPEHVIRAYERQETTPHERQ